MKLHSKTISLIILSAVIIITAFIYTINKTKKPFNAEEYQNRFIGGEFNLINQYGQKTNLSHLKNKFSLLYFGFSSCLSICPNSLNLITTATNKLKKKQQEKLNLVFISVDPDRDTVAVLQKYIKNFHKNFIALTGSNKNIKEITNKYKIYASKNYYDPDNKNSYMVNHSNLIYLLDEDGIFIDHFSGNSELAEIYNKLNHLL